MLHFDSVPDALQALLRCLSPDPALEHFALGGGTSLALRFGHRLSVDLDLFERKYSNTDRFVAIRSLAWFGDAEGEPDPVVSGGPTWVEVKGRITRAIAAL